MKDQSFRDFVVSSKFRAGWVYIAGSQASEREALAHRLKSQGFETFAGDRPTLIAPFVELVARYAFIYGRCSDGDVHQMSHFVEQSVPAAIVALGPLGENRLLPDVAAQHARQDEERRGVLLAAVHEPCQQRPGV